MIIKELIQYCLTYPSAYEDYPFDNITAVMKHSGNHKMFALIAERDGYEYINLKCNPDKADFLRSIYEGVMPGYHMNKTHWNSVRLNSDVSDEELFEMIRVSFDLTKPKEKVINK